MTIRQATEADAPLLAELIRRAFSASAERLGLTLDNCPRHPFFTTPDRVAEMTAEGTAFVIAESDGTPCGCAGLKEHEPGVGALRRLSVLPEWQRRGIGATLVRHVVAQARRRGMARLTLGIIASDHRLRAWYRTFGFADTETKQFDGVPFTVTFMAMDL